MGPFGPWYWADLVALLDRRLQPAEAVVGWISGDRVGFTLGYLEQCPPIENPRSPVLSFC
jgi:hypothetical protein